MLEVIEAIKVLLNSFTRSIKRRAAELSIWLLVPLFIVAPFVTRGRAFSLNEFFTEHPIRAVFAVTFILVPLLFIQIFDESPIVALLQSLSNRTVPLYHHFNIKTKDANRIARNPQTDLIDQVFAAYRVELDAHNLQSLNAAESAKLARQVLRKGNVFVFAGITIAFLGIAIFYFLHVVKPPELPQGATWIDRLLILGQNLGIFFFIEYVALFLLRQYRLNTDEHRYFEALARMR